MNEELNKKLAEWAGFKLQTVWPSYTDLEKVLKWTYPDGSYFREIPNFTQSLDACFKWLVPKLNNLRILMNMAPGGDVYWNAEAYISNTKGVATEETPALALCLAIEKLIDSEKDEQNRV